MHVSPVLCALFVGQPKTITDTRGTWTSSIYRDPITGPVEARPGGLVGDKVTQPYHGGAVVVKIDFSLSLPDTRSSHTVSTATSTLYSPAFEP